MRVLIDFARTHPYRSFATLVCLLLAGVAEGIGLSSLFPVLEIAIADGGGEPSPFAAAVTRTLSMLGLQPTLGTLLLVIVAGITAKAVLVLLANRQVGYAVSSVATDLRLALIAAIMSARWRYFTTRPSGAIANAFTTEAERASLAFLHASMVVAAVIQILLYTAIAAAISWQATVATLLLGAASVWGLGWILNAGRRAGQRQTDLLKSSVAHLGDALHAIKPLRAMARERLMDNVLTRETEGLNRALRGEVLSKEGLKALQEPILVIGLAVGLFAAVTYFSLPMSVLLMFGVLFGRTLGAIAKAQKEVQYFLIRESAYASLVDTIAETEAERESLSGGVTPTLNEAITLSNVSLRYSGEPVLHNVSLRVPAGKLTTFVGPSGSGKTSLADIIVGLVSPDSGTVEIDDLELGAIDRHAWRTMIGYVPQELFLLHESVYTNIALGDPDISAAQVWHALNRVGAGEFVAALPDKLHAFVGEHGQLLSGGQRQRIAIARAIVHEPKLLILDEATAALDPLTENAVVTTISELRERMTILAITHQRAFAEHADVVYRMDAGSVTRER